MSTDNSFIKKFQTPREATENQRNYLNDLIAGRDWEGEVTKLPPAWQELFYANVPPRATKLAMTDVSKFIDLLKGCERKGRMSSDKPIFAEFAHGVQEVNQGTVAIREPLADGFYRSRKDGNVYKVYVTQKGHQVAKVLRVHQHGDNETEVSFEYVGKKPLYSLSNEDRLSLEEAMEFGKLYGRCMICGRTLTNELSIALGIGPVCGDREFGGEYRFMISKLKGNADGDYIDGEVISVDEDDTDAMLARLKELQAKLAVTNNG